MTRYWLGGLIVMALVFNPVSGWTIQSRYSNVHQYGSSMYPTLRDGDYLIIWKGLPFREEPHARGEIVLFKVPRNKSTLLVKRVIGLPGEKLEITEGQVIIDGKPLLEPYVHARWSDSSPPVVIPKDEYFVLGDNRDNSLDSRSSQIGLVPGSQIDGTLSIRAAPISRLGSLAGSPASVFPGWVLLGWTLLAIPVLLVLTVAASSTARARGRSAWWGTLVPLGLMGFGYLLVLRFLNRKPGVLQDSDRVLSVDG